MSLSMSSARIGAEMGQPRLGITHRRRIAFDGTEVSLALDQPFAHRPRLGHVDEGRVDGHVAVRVIFLHRVADDTGALRSGTARMEAHLVHGVENAALRGL